MSDLDSKLEPSRPTSGGKARCTLQHLNTRFGLQVGSPLDPKRPPPQLWCVAMDELELWTLVPGVGSGWGSTYELTAKTPVKGGTNQGS